MKLNTRKALNPAYRKHKPHRKEVDQFTDELLTCLKTIKEIDQANESEEHIKEPIKTFFNKTFYNSNYINTKNRIDLAIYLGKDIKSEVGVIIETKKPSNKVEFLSPENLNRKALHELLLYYLRERIDEKNNNIKHLIATNGYEWFLFKAEDFYNLFYINKSLIKEYEDFRDGKKDSSKNELFYHEIADKYIALVEEQLPFVHLDFTKKAIKDYNDPALNTLYKIFSDVHLLGSSFANDSNQLNKTFYNELLHIIGLEEVKVKGKKLIQRKAEKDRDYGSMLENAIFTIEDKGFLNKIQSIDNGPDKAFNAGLELTLSWINRILFLKLLESQLLTYHNKANEYSFLNSGFIKGFDDLYDLFFSALAKKPEERHPKFKERFKYIPYLNSSLFEPSLLEDEAFSISNMHDEEVDIYKNTVLKDTNGKTQKGKLDTLDYLFRFLDAYDFATDGTEGIEDHESKSLINASVLGLIFEKINGYKEGSFYTPAYITMYMSRETLRRAVVQKFKEQENESIDSFEDLKNYTSRHFKADDLRRFNLIINSIRIVDPAVGSGHFLVSALNELIAIKSELRILIDENGQTLRSEIIVDNDELFITDELGHLLEYKPENKTTAIIQKTLFHEKQNLIENSLFGVDINPNSVKICRLRLWIELLKNAYYTEEGQLQTLPNIDINIKTGNSLISRFQLEDDLQDAFKGEEVQYSFTDYKNAVAEYKTTNDKNRKNEILNIITEVKGNFQSSFDDKLKKKLEKAIGEYQKEKTRIDNLQQFAEKIKKTEKDHLKKLKTKAEKALAQREEILNNKIYHNAFEWRFEFPEVLDNEGKYLGFDVVIGNPPYVQLQSMGQRGKDYGKVQFDTYTSMGDLYALFYEQGNNILKQNGLLSFITGSAWMRTNYGKNLRNYFRLKTNPLKLIDLSDCDIFDSATVLTNIMIFEKSIFKNHTQAIRITHKNQDVLQYLEQYFKSNNIVLEELTESSWIITEKAAFDIKRKVEQQGIKIKDWDLNINRGILTGFNDAFIISGDKKQELIEKDPKSAEILKPVLRGRDVKKYHYEFDDLWLINTHNGIKEKKIEKINIDDYSAIREHLDIFWDKIKKRADKGNTPYNLRNCAYIFEFEKPKIIYPNMTKHLPFSIDMDGNYLNDKCFIMTGDKLHYMVAFLNSKLFRLCYTDAFPELQGNSKEIKKFVMETIPIKEISTEQEQPFIEKVNEILAQKKADPQADTTALEAEIDQMVYELYGLTKEEIAIVEGGA
jgi:adenine-specific DNA-methyltransferase